MARFQDSRICPACTKNNPVDAQWCSICSESLVGVEPVIVRPSSKEPRRSAPSAQARDASYSGGGVLIGIVLGMFIGFMLRPSAPFIGQLPISAVLELTFNGGSGLNQLLVPMAQRSFMIMVAGGVVGGFLGSFAGTIGTSGRAVTPQGSHRQPCPFCAEMIQRDAKICRYCNRSVQISLV